MKQLLIIIMVLLVQVCYGQTYDEWVRQKKTQRKYLIQQIAALKVYGDYLKKGYSIASGGLKTIQGIKKGSFDLHQGFFESLSKISPKVKQYRKIPDIIAMQLAIAKCASQTIKQSKGCGQLSPGEISYFENVFAKLLDECSSDLDALINVITSNQIEMTEDERIIRIDTIYESMTDKQSFVRSFSESAKGLVIQRLNEATDVKISRKLNGIK